MALRHRRTIDTTLIEGRLGSSVSLKSPSTAKTSLTLLFITRKKQFSLGMSAQPDAPPTLPFT